MKMFHIQLFLLFPTFSKVAVIKGQSSKLLVSDMNADIELPFPPLNTLNDGELETGMHRNLPVCFALEN